VRQSLLLLFAPHCSLSSSCFFGRIAEDEAKQLLILDGRPGAYLVRMNLAPGNNDHFFVDFILDSATGTVSTANIKNLGSEYGLRWQSKRAIGPTIGEMLKKAPMLLHPVQQTFAKQRYAFI